MRRHAGAYLKSQNIDVTIDQWGVLGLLFEHKLPISQTELAALIIKDTPTTSRILDILCKKKYVERKLNVEDRRKFDVVLTTQGKYLVKSVNPVVKDIRESIFEGLTKRDFDDLDRVLSKIDNNLSLGSDES